MNTEYQRGFMTDLSESHGEFLRRVDGGEVVESLSRGRR